MLVPMVLGGGARSVHDAEVIDDRLWVATSEGVDRFDPAAGERLPLLKGRKPAYAVEEIEVATPARAIVLLGTESGLLQSTLAGLEPKPIADGPETGPVVVIEAGAPGEAWVGSLKGLFWYRAGPPASLVPVPEVSGEVTAILGWGGKAWVGTRRGSYFRVDSSLTATPLTGVPPERYTTAIREIGGRVWFLTGDKTGAAFWEVGDTLEPVPQLEDWNVESVATAGQEKADQETWVGTSAGLLKWSPDGVDLVKRWPRPENPNDTEIISGIRSLSPAVWVATNHRAYRGVRSSSGYRFDALPPEARNLALRDCLDYGASTWCWGGEGLFRLFTSMRIAAEFENQVKAGDRVRLPDELRIGWINYLFDPSEEALEGWVDDEEFEVQVGFSKAELDDLHAWDCWIPSEKVEEPIPAAAGTVYLRVRDPAGNLASLEQAYEPPGSDVAEGMWERILWKVVETLIVVLLVGLVIFVVCLLAWIGPLYRWNRELLNVLVQGDGLLPKMSRLTLKLPGLRRRVLAHYREQLPY